MKTIREAIGSRLDNQAIRDVFVHSMLESIPPGSRLLDAGAGSQRYRKNCEHLDYVAQDIGSYSRDEKSTIVNVSGAAISNYDYGPIDIQGNVWDIDASNSSFDVILCSEVLEHIPYPIATITEFQRVLRSGGMLILTAPSNCLRHMDPYFFTSGFSDRWFERILEESGFEVREISPVGDYYSWLAVEMARTGGRHSWLAKAVLAPAFAYFKLKKPTAESIDTMCMGYHVLAIKK
ncbi:class I SAM-dependent methyltransferase [Actinomycetota bacterium]|nr:class I SAM-dependent methyltransferase [Actinomycetota bacterium]